MAGGFIFRAMRFGVLFVLVSGVACDQEYERRSWKGKKKRSTTVVEVQELGLGSVSGLLLANAVVESESQASILPTTGGTVLSIHRDEGDVVKRGDLLAVLDNVSLDANAERANAELVRLEQQVKRTRELADQGVVSRRELEDLEYQLSTARTSDREASSTFGETRLVAPFDGVVAARDVRVGEYAGASVVAFQIVDLSALRVVASLPERDLATVRLGQSAKLVSAYDDSIWTTGTVSRIAPVVDATSGTFRVTMSLAPDQQILRPGQFVSVELEVERRENVPVIPRKSIVYEDGRAVVYRMIPAPPPEEDGNDTETKEPWYVGLFQWDGRRDWRERKWGQGGWGDDEDYDDDDESGDAFIAERRTIERGLVDTELVQIISGVDVGDSIVVVGQSNLRDGARIRTTGMSVADNDSQDKPEDKEQEDDE